MLRIIWANDIHLNFVILDRFREFCSSIVECTPDAVIIAGDIGEAPDVIFYLKLLEKELKCPIYFVLGNHDFYKGSIAGVSSDVKDLCKNSDKLFWLTDMDIVEFTEKTCLIGHDSWADGRLGNYAESTVLLNDYLLIEEFRGLGHEERLVLLNELGDRAADKLDKLLPEALAQFDEVIVLTHVPPFKEACFYGDGISDDNYLPHFGCKAVGEVLRKHMSGNPEKQMTVLCGHTHGEGSVDILPNLKIITGGAEYGKPKYSLPLLFN